VGYHDEGRPLFDCPDLVLIRQECAAIIGPNGAGKTTFLKTILEQIPPYAGNTQLGASLEIGYFAQAHEGLSPGNTLMQEIQSVAPQLLPAAVRNFLAKFLFTGDDVFRRVSTLSGGERGRLALAKLSLSDANLLLLDEPTNHLDLPTQEVLESVLSAFPGTILLVSHDRYLIDSLASQIWEVEPQGQRMQVFKGSYTQFKAEKVRRQEEQAAAEKAAQAPSSEKPKPQKTAQKPAKALSKYERKKAQTRLTEIEATLQKLEAQQTEISALLETPPEDADEVLRLGEDYMHLQQQMEDLMAEWGRLEGLLAAES
jgi:ATP-binding cassette subfamily F protein 3